MKFPLALFLTALFFVREAPAAPLTPNSIPAPVEKTDAAAIALLDKSARAYEAAQTLDLTFYTGASGFSDAQTSRLLLRRANNDAHLLNADGSTAQLWTNDRQWLKNQANFVWHSKQRYWKSNLFYSNGLWLPLLGGKNPLHKVADKNAVREVTVLPEQIVRGQKCRGVRQRQWLFPTDKNQTRAVQSYSEEEIWLRADNSLAWEIRVRTLYAWPAEQKISGESALIEIRQMRINPPLDKSAFVYKLPAGALTPQPDRPFWSRELRVGALPPVLVADFRRQTLKLSDYIGRPVVMWFGFSDDDGDLPIARQLARDWTPYGVQIVALPMETSEIKGEFEFPVAMSANDFEDPIIEQFGLKRAPLTMVLARDGTIAALNPTAEALESLLFELLKAPNPTSTVARDAATNQLASQLLDAKQRRATLQLWRERALPRAFSTDESAQLAALLPTLAPFEASQLARVLTSSHGETQAPRVDAIIAAFVSTLSGPIPVDEPEFDRSLSPRAFVLREFLAAFARFDGAERALALPILARLGEQPDADIPDFAAWLTMARAQSGDAVAVSELPALIEAEADVSNAKIMVQVLAQTAGARAAPLLRTLEFSRRNFLAQYDNFDNLNDLSRTIREQLENLENKR